LIFIKPNLLNGTTLVKELAAIGIKIESVDVNGQDLILDIADKDQAKVAAVLLDHDGSPTPDPKATARASALAKLAALGLSADEIAAL
jgi:hypothetical protein